MGRRKTAVGGQSSSSSRHYAETGQSSSSSRHSVEMGQSSPSSRHSVEMGQSSPSSRHSVRTHSSSSSRHSVRTQSSPSSRHSVRTQSSRSSRHSVRTQSSRSSRHSVRTQPSPSSRHSARTQSSPSSRHSVRTQSSPSSRDSLEMGQSSSSSKSGSLPSSSCRHCVEMGQPLYSSRLRSASNSSSRHSIEMCQSCSCPSIRHCSGVPVQNPDFRVVIQCDIPADVLSNNSDNSQNKKRQNENAEQLTDPKRRRTEKGRESTHENLENYPEIDPVELVRQMEEDERMARMLQENGSPGPSRGDPHRQVENSPEVDPVELVRQVEEDEGMARMLQAQFYEANDNVAQEERDDRGIIDPHGNSDSSGGQSRENPHEQLENSLEFDPLAQVIQMEEDERVARMLQAEFEAEGRGNLNFEQLENDADSSNSVLIPDEHQDVEDEEDSQGLSGSNTNRLPTTKNVEPPNSTSCALCLSDYADGDELKLLPCFHKFHKPCVDPWLMKNPTCPVCRVTADTNASYQHSCKSNQHRHSMFEH